MKSNSIISLPLAMLLFGCVMSIGCESIAAIIYTEAPKDGLLIVKQNIEPTIKSHPDFLGGVELKDISFGKPITSYYIGLSDIASGRLISAARLGGWRYTLFDNSKYIGVASLSTNDSSGLSFSGLGTTGFGKETTEALQIAEQLPQVCARNYEPRFLNLPWLSFTAIWLHGDSDDIFIPLPPTFGRMKAYQPLSADQIENILKPDAERRLQQIKAGRIYN